MSRTSNRTGVVAVAVVAALIATAITYAATYNKLVRLDDSARAQWAQLADAYQRRAELVPSLVAAVDGAAPVERDAIAAVTEARDRVDELAAPNHAATNRAALARFQAAQNQLGDALSRLLVAAEAHPSSPATPSFHDARAQLERSESRIAVERMRYNRAARELDTARARFPTSIVAAASGRFARKHYFHVR